MGERKNWRGLSATGRNDVYSFERNNKPIKPEDFREKFVISTEKPTTSSITPTRRFYKNVPYRRGTYSVSSEIKPKIKVIFLGGLNQIGRNMTAFEVNGDILVVDCGMAFPDGEMLGVDLVIPDFSYLEANVDKIRGLVVTHGHEDHIGAIPYFLKKIDVPIYATPLTIGLITGKLKEYGGLQTAKLNVISTTKKFNVGCFEIECIHVNHSIPDAVAFAITSPAGTIVHMGDFKIDCTPTRGKMINLSKFSELGNHGVLALFSDSTNADRPGYTKSEHTLNEQFSMLFQRAVGKRVICATFASNLGRIQQIIDWAVKYDRKVFFSGRSLVNYVTVAKQLNYLDIPYGIVHDIDDIAKFPKSETVIITTGSQGEPMSALYRIAYGEHNKIVATSDDMVIISASPIPGNEKMVQNVVNELLKFGADVIHQSMYDVHVSGHACQEELKIILGIVKPKFFVPIHGERKHMNSHANLALEMGMPAQNIYVGDVGDIIEISENCMKQVTKIPMELILVDGSGVGDVGSIVLRDRKLLSQDGIIVTSATINMRSRKIVAGPEMVSRGFVYVKESEELMKEAKAVVANTISKSLEEKFVDWSGMRLKVRDDLSKFFHAKTRRKPMILPMILSMSIK